MECRNCPNLRHCRHQCMDLPSGKTCADCIHAARCTQMFGAKLANTKCDFEPIRFREKEIKNES